jgi:hypothetical protein
VISCSGRILIMRAAVCKGLCPGHLRNTLHPHFRYQLASAVDSKSPNQQ